MNFQDFEKKAKCLYCDRPINIKSALYSQRNTYKCECSLSKRTKHKDGFSFVLPVSNKFQIMIDTEKKLFKIIIVECLSDKPGKRATQVETLLEVDEIPDFINLTRLKLIDRLEEFIAFI